MVKDKNEVFLSVIVPVYNVEKYLCDCLQSLVLQTIPFDEIILVDDGSTDNGKTICEDYCHNYKNIILVRQENKGLSAARNVGMECAKGKYILFIDSDDFITLDTSEILRGKLYKTDLDVLYFNADVKYDIKITEAKYSYVRDIMLCGYIMSGIEYLIRSFPENHIVSSCMAAYKKEFLQKNNIFFPEGIYYEDNVFQLKVVVNAKQVECISNQFYIRRYRENSIMTSAMTEKKCKSLIKVQLLIWDYIDEYVKISKYKIFFRNYIAHGILNTLMTIDKYNDSGKIIEKKMLINKFLEYWFYLFQEAVLPLDDCSALLAVLQTLDVEVKVKEKRFLIDKYFGKKENFIMFYNNIQQSFRKNITKKIESLPFNDKNKKVGIYGTGKHTLSLIKFYEDFVGDISSSIYFIVTEKKEVNTFLDRPIVSCYNIPNDTNAIVVSSRIYQNEIVEQLLRLGINENIYTIYKKEDVFDLVTAEKIYNRKRVLV